MLDNFKSQLCGFAAQKYSIKPQLKFYRLTWCYERQQKIKLNLKVKALIVTPLLVALSILHFSIGMTMFLVGNLLIIFLVIRTRFKGYGAVSLIDPVIGITQKISFSKQPAIFIGLILSGSFVVGLVLKFVYMLIVS